MARCTAVLVLVAVLAPRVAAEEAKLLREVPGPQGTNDARAIFSHMDSVVFSPDGKLMAAGAGANVFVWNVADGKELVRMQLPKEQIYHRLIFAPDGKTLFWNGREDPKMRVFDVATGKQVREFDQPNGMGGEKEFSSRFLCYSPDAKLVAYNSEAFFQGFEIYDTAGTKVVGIADTKDVRGCAFSPDGKQIATLSGEGGLHVWDVKTGRLFRELQADGQRNGGAYKFVVWSPDGQFLASGGHNDKGLAVWSLKARKKVCTIPCEVHFYHAAFSPDGQSILCAENFGKPYLYHLIAETKTAVFTPPVEQGLFVTWLPDGKRVAVIGNATKAEVRQQSVFLFELTAEQLNPKAAQVDEAPPEKLWDELTTENELRLDRVVKALKGAPGPTVMMLTEKLTPVGKEPAVKVEQWLIDLDDAVPARREAATKELAAVAHRFAPLLQSRLEGAAPGEVRNRLTFILKKMAEEATPRELVRDVLAVGLAEQLGTPDAVGLLRKLAAGAEKTRVTEEARAAVARLEKGK